MISRKLHNRILIYTARLVLAVMCTCLCMLDSEKRVCITAFVIAMMCAGYLALYTYANRDCKGEII